MSKAKDEALSPIHISKVSWAYADKGALLVVHEARDADGAYIQTDNIKIPWKTVLKALTIYRRTYRARARRVKP